MSNIGDYQALVAAFTVDFTSQYSGAVSVACKDAEELKNVQEALNPLSEEEQRRADILASIEGPETERIARFCLPHGRIGQRAGINHRHRAAADIDPRLHVL